MKAVATCFIKNRPCLFAPHVRHAGSIEVGYQKSIVGCQVGPIWITTLTMTCVAIQEVHLHSEEQLRDESCIPAQDTVTSPSQRQVCCAAHVHCCHIGHQLKLNGIHIPFLGSRYSLQVAVQPPEEVEVQVLSALH